MKYLNFFWIVISLLTIVILPDIFSDNGQSTLKPSEDFFVMRNYPNAHQGYKVYLNEMHKLAQTQILKALRKSENQNPQWIIQGPYNIGGRINTIAVNPENTNVIYIGTVSGGIFKTENGGTDWFPIFDDNTYLAIAHIVIDPVDTSTIYVGTGDPNISGYPWVGNGIYKSTDAGKSWTHLGLSDVGIVTKIAVNPKNTQEIYAATMGIPFERDENRGLYKTIDGGENWEKILYLSTDAGIIDMVMLEQQPDTLFVAGWNRIRNYTESVTSGNNCKIYRTFNGGQSWDTLTTDLPVDDISRIGLFVSTHEETAIIAQFVNNSFFETEGIYKTTDFGNSWSQLNANGIDNILGGFGWYFAKVRVNPYNKNQYFVLGVDLYRSDDGGVNFQISTPPWYSDEVHADKHDLVFVDEQTLLLSTDGGLYKSSDGGNNWVDIENIPNTQFYRVAADPFNNGYYGGGAQDNGTSYGHRADSSNWEHIYGGDGFQLLFDHQDPSVIYCETQNGGLTYAYRNSNNYNFYDFTDGINSDDRRSWDMPITMSDTVASLMYTGTYRVYKNQEAPSGSWQAISDDLTDGTQDRYHVITAIDASPIAVGYVMAGTSDGRVHVYNNNAWTNISEGLPERYVTCVRMSASDSSHLFVSHSGYKANEHIPHIHFSNDFGQTWIDISGNLPELAVNSIFVLNHYHDSVIFVATDGGVYHTLNRGDSWERTGANMPVFPVYDLAYDHSNHVLVAGTFARSIMTIALESIVSKYPEASTVKLTRDVAFAVYPNPASDYITFEYPDKLQNAHVYITDVKGSVLLSRPVFNSGEKVNLDNFLKGIYFVSIADGKNILATKKVLVN